MRLEKLSQCFSLVTAPLMFHGTWHISGLQELALRHFLSCLLLWFKFWDRVSLCRCREPGESVVGFEMEQTEQARLFIRSKQIIVEKVRAAAAGNKWAACWCAQQDDKVKKSSCHKADIVERRVTDEQFYPNQQAVSQKQAAILACLKGQNKDTVNGQDAAALHTKFRRADNTQLQKRTRNNNNQPMFPLTTQQTNHTETSSNCDETSQMSRRRIREKFEVLSHQTHARINWKK